MRFRQNIVERIFQAEQAKLDELVRKEMERTGQDEAYVLGNNPYLAGQFMMLSRLGVKMFCNDEFE